VSKTEQIAASAGAILNVRLQLCSQRSMEDPQPDEQVIQANGLPDGAVRADSMLGIILIVVVVLLIAGAFPRWNHSRSWGYYPSGGLGLVLIILVVLLLLGRI
jgi:hypothetical protein